MRIPMPQRDVPILDQQTGLMNQVWYDYFQSHQKLVNLPDVSTTPPTDTQVLRYVAATKLWTPSA